VVGVSCSLLCVQSILVIVLIINLILLFNSTKDQLLRQVNQQIKGNYVQASEDTADQIDSLYDFTKWNVGKVAAVLEQIMEPTYFNEYPLDWTQTQLVKFDEIPADVTNPLLSYSHSTYSASKETLTQNAQDFVKKMLTFDVLLQRQLKLYLGPNKDINLNRVFAIY